MMKEKSIIDEHTPIVDQIELAPEISKLYAEAFFGKLVKDINQKIRDGENYESVLDFIFDSLGPMIPFDRIGIGLVNESCDVLKLHWVRSKQPVVHLVKNYSASIKEGSLSALLETGTPRIINNLAEYAREHPLSESTRFALEDGIKSSLTCPLMVNKKPIGIVFFSSFKINAYEHNHVEVFSSIANQLAVIVERDRLSHFFSDNEDMVQSFRSTIHDLRAPLSILQSYIDFAKEEEWYKALEPEVQGIFSTLHRNTQYMFQLLEDLTQMQASELELQRQNVIETCKEMAKRGEALAKAKDITFQSSFVNLPDFADFNLVAIGRVLDNLFSNAVKFSPRNSQIMFSVEATENKLVFTVKDSGLGIPESEQRKLFHKFGKTTTRPTEGEQSTGLGLAISRKFVEQHHGKISVESKSDAGSTFSFWIPLMNREHIKKDGDR